MRRTGAGELGRVLELAAAAPDGNSVALTTHDGRLLLLDPDGEARCGSWPAAATARSPTSRGRPTARGSPTASRRRLGPLAGSCSRGSPTACSSPVTEAAVPATPIPAFTIDGKYLAFLSRRSFDPIYDEHSFDLSFPASWRPFLVPLARAHAVAVRGEPGRPAGLARPRRSRRTRPRSDEPAPATRPRRRRRRPRRPKKEGRGRRPRSSSTSRGCRPRGAGAGGRGPLQRDARGQGLPALVPQPRHRRARRRPRGHRRRRPSGRCWSATTWSGASSTSSPTR